MNGKEANKVIIDRVTTDNKVIVNRAILNKVEVIKLEVIKINDGQTQTNKTDHSDHRKIEIMNNSGNNKSQITRAIKLRNT